MDLPFRAIPAILKGIERLKNRDRVEFLRTSIAAQGTKKYVEDLMKFYVDGSRSPFEIERKKPKSVSTEDAFSALKQLMGR